MQQASDATQEAQAFMAEVEQQPRSAADANPSSHAPDRPLDIKCVTSLVSSYVPVSKAAGSVQEAKYWLNSARNASDTLSVANQHASDALFASALANRLQGESLQWYRCTYHVATPERQRASQHLLSAFEQRYILSRSVQQSIRTKFMDLPSRCANQKIPIHQVYDTMTQLLELMPDDTRTSVPDQMATLMRCVLDDEVRRDANRDTHASLEDAYQAIQKALAVRQHNHHLRKPTPKPAIDRSKFPHSQFNSKPLPWPKKQGNPRFNNMVVPNDPATMAQHMLHQTFGTAPPVPPPHVPTLPVPAPVDASVPRLNKLTDAERAYCVEHRLCFKCRKPGHTSSQCPTRDSENMPGPASTQQR